MFKKLPLPHPQIHPSNRTSHASVPFVAVQAFTQRPRRNFTPSGLKALGNREPSAAELQPNRGTAILALTGRGLEARGTKSSRAAKKSGNNGIERCQMKVKVQNRVCHPADWSVSARITAEERAHKEMLNMKSAPSSCLKTKGQKKCSQ